MPHSYIDVRLRCFVAIIGTSAGRKDQDDGEECTSYILTHVDQTVLVTNKERDYRKRNVSIGGM